MSREKSIGIDPSKEKLDVYATSTGEHKSFQNSTNGVKRLLKYVQSIAPDIVTIETTSKYHRKAARFLSNAGVPILLAQPRRIRDFAKGLGVLAKTDSLDARCIALYGEKSDLPETKLVSHEEEFLKDIIARRQQITEVISAEKCKLSSTPSALKESCKRTIEFLEKEKKRIDELIKKQLEKCVEAQKKVAILTSAKGVGNIVAAILVANLPELGTLSKRQVASLSGLAPFNHDSGGMRGKRSIYGGRAVVRSALYMAALTASRHDEVLAELYQKLLNKGKPKKVALVAVMRKLIIKLNAMIKNGATCAVAQKR